MADGENHGRVYNRDLQRQLAGIDKKLDGIAEVQSRNSELLMRHDERLNAQKHRIAVIEGRVEEVDTARKTESRIWAGINALGAIIAGLFGQIKP